MLDGDMPGWGEKAWVHFLRIAPLRPYSWLIGLLGATPVPRPLRGPLLGRIAARVGIDLNEAELELVQYRSFREIFTRRLHPGARPLPADQGIVVSPVDAAVSAFGVACEGTLIQAKGIGYSLADLTGDPALAKELEGGVFVTLYLNPGGYHRIHSPVVGRITEMRRIPGSLFPVKPYMVRSLRGLFVRNERLVLKMRTSMGTMAMVCVAAAGVGNISVTQTVRCSSGAEVDVGLGDEVAVFNLGSTVILVLPPGRAVLRPLIPEQRVLMGQVLAGVVEQEATDCSSRRFI